MKKLLFLLLLPALISCGNDQKSKENLENNPETDSLETEKEMEFKVLDSKNISQDSLWAPFKSDLAQFSEEKYNELKPLIFDKNIPEIQSAIKNGKLTYKELSLFYLYRIQQFDRENELSLNSVISLNPNLLEEAERKDEELKNAAENHPIYGIPILLKDNINTENMATTAGALALENNHTEDAFIVQKLKENGALILGKANLSEWAYFFCNDCPSGYSAVGGQTLNPYGRKIFDTGGSSSGSAVAVAANLAPVAVGSETSGSILSPSSQNSVVGLKPTIGNLSRGGIVPISSYLDTPGPITKSVIDNAIMYSAMIGEDKEDAASVEVKNADFNLENQNLEGKRFGAFKELMEDSLYYRAVQDLKDLGAEIVEFEAEEVQMDNFLRLLSLDMKKDLPEYFEKYGGETGFSSVDDIVKFNNEDSTARMPYGQSLFTGIIEDSADNATLDSIKTELSAKGKKYFDAPMKEHNLDGILSINNYHAGFAAVAHYPAITVPMGYNEEGAPKGLTFFAKTSEEDKLYQWALAFENATNRRRSPENYE
ncbi:amidase family protein [Salegentibacter salarius]|uniref:Amidase n=1 Tax=Salegentibacter salarius TaxID=435906 RepID=A0A2N0TW27_9FLAO|nr:amidase family protein [Salegentibacter salarius]OEY72647.1 amidase [Salegentibacter salarius]PKD18944.1 amidase [Salegentibacter salarius]SLK01348.1 amidase [Salegentibacter salarius]